MRRFALVVLLVIGAAALLAVPSSGRVGVATSATGFASTGGLDCNGFSPIQRPVMTMNVCADFTGYDGGRGFDNGHYVGHDEPTIQFNSSVPGSGNNVQWHVTLPHEHSLPATQSFENEVTFWFSMALCDPQSFPQNPCTPNSDTNTGISSSTSSGSAFLEMQFYPPGFSPFVTQISCDTTHWCASLHINSLECTADFETCNPNCTETTNFAFIQRDGIPTGPPGAADLNEASATPNSETLLMNQGDHLVVTIHDTSQGVMTRIDDTTTGQSGFMVASAANGYQSLNVNSCAPTNFDFHPEYSTAKVGNWVPWAALQANVGFSAEIGHFEPGVTGDNDGDDPPCFPGPTVAGCLGSDTDFDGTSYLADWPDGSSSTPESIQVSAPHSAAGGSGNYAPSYPKMQFETDALASEATCTPTGEGCTVPPAGAAFYPFYSTTSQGANCAFLFGNDVAGLTNNDYGKDAQYGTPNLPWFFGTASSGIRNNPC